MQDHKLHYAFTTNKKGKSSLRLRHLKYIKSVNHSNTDLKFKKIGNNNNLAFKREFGSLKAINKLEVSHSQRCHTSFLNHFYRLAKNLKKVSFLQIYDHRFINSSEDKTKSVFLSHAKNLKSLGFSYEVQDPNFCDYRRFYDTVLTLNGSATMKCSQKDLFDNICATMQELNVVLPRDIVFVVDFRVSNEILDYPPVNRLTHTNENYIWNLATSYFTLSNIDNPYAFKFDSLWNIRKVFLSCDSSNRSFNDFISFLGSLSNIDSIHVQLKKAIHEQVISFKDLVLAFHPSMKWINNLKKLVIECDDILFDPIELADVVFPESLTNLQLNLKNTQIQSLKNIDYIEQFPDKLKALTNLKKLKLGLPTTCLVNQMIHNMPETLQEIEVLQFDFSETSNEAVYEEIYVNSLLECISNMPKLRELYVRTDKLNYTYCAYLSNQSLPTNLKKIQWIDEVLDCTSRAQKEVQTKQWIECKKFEDLNIMMKLLSENLEHLEIPLVFDGLESEFVALRLLESLSELKKLRNLNLAFGFKTLDEANVESMNNFITNVKSEFDNREDFQMNLNIYYRKTKASVNIEDVNSLINQSDTRGRCHVQYIHDIHY